MVNNAKFFGIMIDENINISDIGHLVIFATFVEEIEVVNVVFDQLRIKDGKKDEKNKILSLFWKHY